MKQLVLRTSRELIRRGGLPGRYLLTEFVAKICIPANKVVEGNIGDYHVTFDFGDQVQRQIYFGLYDEPETRLLRRLLKQGNTFIDAGANVGYFSLLASQIVGASGSVHAFEPIADNIAAIERAIEGNGVTNVRLNQLAVGASKGSLTLYTGDELGNSGWASSIPSARRPKTITIDMTSIDEYVQEKGIERIHLVKMDIEGGELDALSGMSTLMEHPQAPDILCEVNPYLLDHQQRDSRALTHYLASYGYTLYRADALFGGAINPDRIISALTNVFCTKDPHKVRNLI